MNPRSTRPVRPPGTPRTGSRRTSTRATFLLVLAMLSAAVLAWGSVAASAEPERPLPTRADTRELAPASTDSPATSADDSGTGDAARANGRASTAGRTRGLPPGAEPGDLGPSQAIFPPQKITIRFDHSAHVKGRGIACTTCHTRATRSEASSDRLLPSPTTCDTCHDASHADLDHVVRSSDHAESGCETCHEGYREGDGNRVARMEWPAPNLVFNHRKHADRNIGCAQCHGDVQDVGIATRAELPRMRGCLRCHQHPDPAARGSAKASCDTCHLTEGPGSQRLRTTFPTGVLTPPSWMHGAAHTPDFLTRHKYVAGSDSAFCGDCHKQDDCTGCHDGRVRPRSVHPNDYLSMHAVEARLATQKCTSCHREQSFCLGCHQRLGVSMSGPLDVREAGRFHPSKSIWSDPPRRPGHHAFEAMRNLDACVSCHIERDCVACHGAGGVGGGFNPHGSGFLGGCATQLRRNPRPCYVCHEASDPSLESCR